MNINDANLLVNQLSSITSAKVDVFSPEGDYICGLSSRKDSLHFDLVKKIKDDRIVIDSSDNVISSITYAISNMNTILGIIRFSNEQGLSSSLSSILDQWVRFAISTDGFFHSNSLKERSIRDFGRDLVKDIDEEKYLICQKNAKVLDINLDVPRYIFVLDYSDNFLEGKVVSEYELQGFKNYVYSSTKHIVKDSIFFNLYKETYVLLYEIKNNTIINVNDLYDSFSSIVSRRPIMGVGYICSNITNYSTSLNLALSAINYGRIIKPGQYIFRWDEFQIPILMLSGSKKIRDAILNASVDLINYLTEHVEITKTIIDFFDCGMNIDKTAEKMHYHRNTILYRLKNFVEETSINLFNAKNCSEVYNLILLLQAERDSK